MKEPLLLIIFVTWWGNCQMQSSSFSSPLWVESYILFSKFSMWKSEDWYKNNKSLMLIWRCFMEFYKGLLETKLLLNIFQEKTVCGWSLLKLTTTEFLFAYGWAENSQLSNSDFELWTCLPCEFLTVPKAWPYMDDQMCPLFFKGNRARTSFYNLILSWRTCIGDRGISILRNLPFYSEVRQERKDTVTAERRSCLWQCSSFNHKMCFCCGL